MGTADFNQDGKTDVFLHNSSTGAHQIWFMDGVTRTTWADLDSLLNIPDSTGWRFTGTGDFDQDGKTDIFWHNGISGASQVWYMNGATRTGATALPSILNVTDSSGWHLVTISDFNHDGKPDVLAHNGVTGDWQVWFMDNVNRASASNLSTGLNVTDSSGWSVINR